MAGVLLSKVTASGVAGDSPTQEAAVSGAKIRESDPGMSFASGLRGSRREGAVAAKDYNPAAVAMRKLLQ